MNDGSLPPQYVSGLVDGEGCFVLGFRRDKRYERKGQPEYFYWNVGFAILLRSDDHELLEKVRNTLGCGGVSVSADAAQYRVYRIEDLKYRIVPFFTENRIHGKKGKDFILWAEAVAILYETYRKRKAADRKGQQGFPRVRPDVISNQRLLALKKEMETYKATGHTWKWLCNLDEESHAD